MNALSLNIIAVTLSSMFIQIFKFKSKDSNLVSDIHMDKNEINC